jgi:hypothetical protein
LDFSRHLPSPPTSSTVHKNPATALQPALAPSVLFDPSNRKRQRNYNQKLTGDLAQDDVVELIEIDDFGKESTAPNQSMPLEPSISSSVDPRAPQSSKKISLEQFSEFLDYVRSLEDQVLQKEGRIKSMEKTIS